jgi:hypothetical protein
MILLSLNMLKENCQRYSPSLMLTFWQFLGIQSQQIISLRLETLPSHRQLPVSSREKVSKRKISTPTAREEEMT